jgi:hypothetical protein
MSFSLQTTKEIKMKKVLIAAAVAASCIAPQAFAQTNGASGFTGFSAAANANASTSSTEVSGSGAYVDMGKSSQDVSLQAAYGFALGNNYVLGLGATYALGDLKFGSASAGNLTASLKGKDAYSIYLEPGYAFSSSTLVYAKLAYLGMKGEVEGSSRGSEDFSGVGYGVGVRHKLNKNLFLQGEITQADYSGETVAGTSFKPSGTTGTVGIGYQF